jgi:hypothetical protein
MPTKMPVVTPLVLLQRLFVCFEDEVPNRFLASEHGENVRFLLELVDEATAMGIQVGVYTTRNDWLNTVTDRIGPQLVYHITNTTTTDTNPFSGLPLWTPRFDSRNSMDFYAPFGDWEAPLLKQVTGATTALHRIGSDRVELNYMDDELALQYADEELLELIVL